ncbi:LysE family translocator [Phyllobacterium sp. YR531]|uniref:LysE family translocator n=1 Tax=Phyllobacterium sp. YR531 TaxID=1144343 RepID=UPI00026FBB94|nr:LysE family translocator [Phyllobacterium sp. YR531]EJM99423.1 putative threonine efflux protein [Phyllobacterium sp. YR531]
MNGFLENLALYIVACLAIIVIPGPGLLYVISRTVSGGKDNGLASAFGVAGGNFGNAIGSACGLALLFKSYPASFEVVKILGAMYLAYLGVKTLFSLKENASQDAIKESNLHILKQGLIVSFLNPKTTLFFAAFLPMFVSKEAEALPQILLFAMTFVFLALIFDIAVVLSASLLKKFLLNKSGRNGSIFSYLSAAALFSLSALSVMK